MDESSRAAGVEYPVDNTAAELRRLAAQARLFDPLTRRLLVDAGLGPGMRVLDAGSGHGDVALLAADLVGAGGSVVGMDRSRAAVAAASHRAAAAGVSHVRFVEGDPVDATLDQPFDALVGRLILMYYGRPAGALRRMIRHVRRGGLVIFHESDYHGRTSVPPAPTYDRCLLWIREVLTAVGAQTEMGFRLRQAFVEAGLPAPHLSAAASLGGGEAFDGYAVIAEIIRGMLPNLERFRIATSAEVNVDTLEARLRAEVVTSGGVIVLPTLVGAWCHVP